MIVDPADMIQAKKRHARSLVSGWAGTGSWHRTCRRWSLLGDEICRGIVTNSWWVHLHDIHVGQLIGSGWLMSGRS